MADLSLGIDFGTSGARAAVVDGAGQLLDLQRQDFPGVGELSEQWQWTLTRLLGRVPQDLQRRITAIAINGTSGTVLLVNRGGHSIQPPQLYNQAVSNEVRSHLQDWVPTDSPAHSATSSLAKLVAWEQAGALGVGEESGQEPGRLYLMHQADWLGFLLHGQLGLSDYHNALKLGYDVATLTYPDWLTASAVAPYLPKVLAPGDLIGPIQPSFLETFDLHFPAHCQIHAGTTDSIAAFLASGAQQPGEAVTSLGSTLVLKLLSTSAVNHSPSGIYSHRLGNRWLVGGASNTGGAVLQQFFSDDQLQQLSAQIPTDQPSPLDYYPLLEPGERFPINDPHLAPRLSPRPADDCTFLHGLLESMARIEAQGYAHLQTLGASALTQVYTAGGGAQNTPWQQIRHRHLNVPVIPSPQPEAAYGTARLAAGLLQKFT